MRIRLLFAVLVVICVAIAVREGSEFSGGTLTGPLLTLSDVGAVLLLVALLLCFIYPRVAAGTGILASLLCLRLYLYFVAPGPVRRVFRGEYSVPLKSNFAWNTWDIAGVVATTALIFLGATMINQARGRRVP